VHFLVDISNNAHEWADAMHLSDTAPRLPLPYAFGPAFLQRGHRISAIDINPLAGKAQQSVTFERIYSPTELLTAMKSVDVVSLWGPLGISSMIKKVILPRPRPQTLLKTYVWPDDESRLLHGQKLAVVTKFAARFAGGLVVMTAEQFDRARDDLNGSVPVVYFRCGVDTGFYRKRSDQSCIPYPYSAIVDRLLENPFVIMSGDELRCNEDAIKVVQSSKLCLVRVCQYPHKSGNAVLDQQIKDYELEDCFVKFERISYLFLHFLFQYAVAYAGLVDSTWQPAGWTVACEALASGLPVVVYEGIVSRELQARGATEEMVRVVPLHEVDLFREALEETVRDFKNLEARSRRAQFAAECLDIEAGGNRLVTEIEAALRG
jgi:glycosyltransferase involved in cell wall biosynthesis